MANDDRSNSTASPRTMFAFVCAIQLRALLRPSARRDLSRFLKARRSVQELGGFVAWAQDVLEAHRVDRHGLRNRRTAHAIQADPLGAFRRPMRAFRLRRPL